MLATATAADAGTARYSRAPCTCQRHVNNVINAWRNIKAKPEIYFHKMNHIYECRTHIHARYLTRRLERRAPYLFLYEALVWENRADTQTFLQKWRLTIVDFIVDAFAGKSFRLVKIRAQKHCHLHGCSASETPTIRMWLKIQLRLKCGVWHSIRNLSCSRYATVLVPMSMPISLGFRFVYRSAATCIRYSGLMADENTHSHKHHSYKHIRTAYSLRHQNSMWK